MLAPDDSGEGDFRQAGDERFDLGGIDPFSAGLDQILGPARNEKLAVFTDFSKVACQEPAIARRGFSLAEIALDYGRAAHPEMAFVPALLIEGRAFMIGEHQIDAKRRTACRV